MDLGLRFKRFRERSNLTQKEAAAIIGVKAYQLGNYETNRSEPSISILKGMSRAYNVSIDALVGNNRSKNEEESNYNETELEDLLNELIEHINKRNKK